MDIVRWNHVGSESLVGALSLPLRTPTGVRYVERRSGGAWRAVNEFGVAVRIVNGARLGSSGGRRSRSRLQDPAQLAAVLIDCQDIRAVCEHLLSLDLARYAPFTLAASEPGLPTAIAEWDGRECAILLNGDSFIPLFSGPSEPANLMP
jgi:hypothetical protein